MRLRPYGLDHGHSTSSRNHALRSDPVYGRCRVSSPCLDIDGLMGVDDSGHFSSTMTVIADVLQSQSRLLPDSPCNPQLHSSHCRAHTNLIRAGRTVSTTESHYADAVSPECPWTRCERRHTLLQNRQAADDAREEHSDLYRSMTEFVPFRS